MKGAVEEYKRCAIQHKATPLQFELTCALLRNGDMTTEFQEMLNASSSVHGVPSTYVNLAVALAELGYVKQLRQYLSVTQSSVVTLTPWLMEPGGSMPHSQGLSNNPCPELNQPNSSY